VGLTFWIEVEADDDDGNLSITAGGFLSSTFSSLLQSVFVGGGGGTLSRILIGDLGTAVPPNSDDTLSSIFFTRSFNRISKSSSSSSSSSSLSTSSSSPSLMTPSFPSLDASASPPSDDSAVIPEEEGFTPLILSSSQLAEEGSWFSWGIIDRHKKNQLDKIQMFTEE
jgi:hypothetical protein